MGSGRGASAQSVVRALRTAFFMVILVVSLLLSSAPLLVSVIDIIAPCIVLSTFGSSSCLRLNNGWAGYSFRTSLVDIPLLSLIRSLAIFCAYSVCGIPSFNYGPYLGTTAICGLLSAILLILKACILKSYDLSNPIGALYIKHTWGILCLLLCSMVLALGHVLVAFKVKSQAQRKMHLYKLDPEAVVGLYARLYQKQHRQGGWEDKALQKEFIEVSSF